MKAARKNWEHVGLVLLTVMLGDDPDRLLCATVTLPDKLDAIKRQQGSDEEACLKVVIEAFLLGESQGFYNGNDLYYQLSWRSLIHVLYLVGDTSVAQDIISYAEPVEGERENV